MLLITRSNSWMELILLIRKSLSSHSHDAVIHSCASMLRESVVSTQVAIRVLVVVSPCRQWAYSESRSFVKPIECGLLRRTILYSLQVLTRSLLRKHSPLFEIQSMFSPLTRISCKHSVIVFNQSRNTTNIFLNSGTSSSLRLSK